MDKSWSAALGPAPPSPLEWCRRGVAAALHQAGSRLLAWAKQWQLPEQARPAGPQTLEFHAEAGAPEGALYVDGQRVGVLPGVTRL